MCTNTRASRSTEFSVLHLPQIHGSGNERWTGWRHLLRFRPPAAWWRQIRAIQARRRRAADRRSIIVFLPIGENPSDQRPWRRWQRAGGDKGQPWLPRKPISTAKSGEIRARQCGRRAPGRSGGLNPTTAVGRWRGQAPSRRRAACEQGRTTADARADLHHLHLPRRRPQIQISAAMPLTSASASSHPSRSDGQDLQWPRSTLPTAWAAQTINRIQVTSSTAAKCRVPIEGCGLCNDRHAWQKESKTRRCVISNEPRPPTSCS
ncbi:hypothetical protein ACLOJK_030997 [Asimina triloba]